MSVAQGVGPDAEAYACAVEGGFPDVLAKPGSGNVPAGDEGAAADGPGLAGRRAASGASRCSGLTGQQTGRPYSASLRWTMASYSCSYVIGGSGIGCARSAR
jgi:hypothetical protein